MADFRRCKKCGRDKLLIEFQVYDLKHGWRRHECIGCQRARMNVHYWDNREHYKKRAADNYKKRPSSQWTKEQHERTRSNARRYRREWREVVVTHYGAKCECCGEDNPGFLTLDHINGDGREMRKKHGVGLRLYRWIMRNNYPSFFRVLCYNCNCGRDLNGGVCPHVVLQERFNDYSERKYAASDRRRKPPAFKCEG